MTSRKSAYKSYSTTQTEEGYSVTSLNDMPVPEEEDLHIQHAREDMNRDIKKKEEEMKIKMQMEKELEVQGILKTRRPNLHIECSSVSRHKWSVPATRLGSGFGI